MQLILNTSKHKSMQILDESIVFQEETGEIVLPDTQPDVIRVLDTFANVLLKSKEAEQGRAVIKGVLQTTVIYAAKDEGMYRVEHPIPFTVVVNKQNIVSDCALSAAVDVMQAEAVISNSRKVVVRLNLKAALTCFAFTEPALCIGIDNEAVFQKTKTVNISSMSEYTEKTFVISDEVILDDKQDLDFDILSCEYRFKDVEYSFSGTRMIIRGKLETDVCWIASDKVTPSMCKWTTEFSQVLDAECSDISDCARVNMMMTGCYCDSGSYSRSGDVTSAAIEVHAVAQCEIFESRELCLLDDFYCVSAEAEGEWEELAFAAGLKENEKIVKINEKICSSDMFDEIVSSRITFGEVHRENDQYKVNGYISVCGYNRNMEAISVKNGFQVNCDCENTCGIVSVKADCISAEVSGDDLIISCDVIFASRTREIPVIRNLKNALINEDKKYDNTPSVVLYRFGIGDTLWSIGKKYLSSCELIKTANGIEDEEEKIHVGKMILIPKA